MQTNTIKPLLSEEEVRRKVKDLGAEISKDYRDRTVHVVGVLEDSFVFMADLVRAITSPVRCHFLKVTVRDVDKKNGGIREVFFTTKIDISGKDILLVEGILQTGVTLEYLIQQISRKNPKSLRSAVLVNKKSAHKVDIPTDYVAFEVEEKFLVGYGLGHKDQYRQLPYLAAI